MLWMYSLVFLYKITVGVDVVSDSSACLWSLSSYWVASSSFKNQGWMCLVLLLHDKQWKVCPFQKENEGKGGEEEWK